MIISVILYWISDNWYGCSMASFQDETNGGWGDSKKIYSDYFDDRVDMSGIIETTGKLAVSEVTYGAYPVTNYDEEDEYNGVKVRGFARLSPAERVVRIDLRDPPLFGVVEEKMTNVTEDGGVKKLVLKKGTGKMLPAGCEVWFHYVSFIKNEKTFFDSTISRRTTQSCKLDEFGYLIKGLQLGLKSMEFREVAQFMIQPNYAYGDSGSPPKIPGGSILFFNVKILNLVTERELKTIPFMSPQDRAKEPFDDVCNASIEKRSLGNRHYERNWFWGAVNEYRRGINYLKAHPTASVEQDLQKNDIVTTMYINMAQCYLKMSKYPQACNACKNALRGSCPQYEYKILFRFAQANFKLGSPHKALDLVRQAIKCSIEPLQEILDYEKMIVNHIKRTIEDKKMFSAVTTAVRQMSVNGRNGDQNRSAEIASVRCGSSSPGSENSNGRSGNSSGGSTDKNKYFRCV